MTNTNGKVQEPELRAKALELVESAKEPCDIQFIADKLRVAWGTARVILLNLRLDNRIAAIHTSKGWIFYGREKEFAVMP